MKLNLGWKFKDAVAFLARRPLWVVDGSKVWDVGVHETMGVTFNPDGTNSLRFCGADGMDVASFGVFDDYDEAMQESLENAVRMARKDLDRKSADLDAFKRSRRKEAGIAIAVSKV